MMISFSLTMDVGDGGGHWISFLRTGDWDAPKTALREVGGDGDRFHWIRRPVTGDCGVLLPLRYSFSEFGGGQTHFLPFPRTKR